MKNIIINNSTVSIYVNNDKMKEARDTLLTKMYYARNKDTMGGYNAWLQLLDWYYSAEYDKMIDHIRSCKGKGGKTRNECIECIYTIIGG